MRRLQNIFNIRPQMVKLAQEKGICESARLRNTTGKTVRKWVTRYREGGLRGLANRKSPNAYSSQDPKRDREQSD
ncbi:MAG: helix-turn-helix domain-containing protein [Candidatus Oleimicrobiaceae bacterium]